MDRLLRVCNYMFFSWLFVAVVAGVPVWYEHENRSLLVTMVLN